MPGTVSASILAQMNQPAEIIRPANSSVSRNRHRRSDWGRIETSKPFREPGAGLPQRSEELVSEWRLIWTAVLPVNTLSAPCAVECLTIHPAMFTAQEIPLAERVRLADPSDFREPISSSVWGRLENFRTNQVRRYRAPRLKPEGLVSGGGDVPPPPGCGNPLMQEFITKLQEKDGSLSRLPAGHSQKPNEYGG
jgi:hypothetical protein